MYEKHDWKNNELITEEKLDHIENGIVGLDHKIDAAVSDMSRKVNIEANPSDTKSIKCIKLENCAERALDRAIINIPYYDSSYTNPIRVWHLGKSLVGALRSYNDSHDGIICEFENESRENNFKIYGIAEQEYISTNKRLNYKMINGSSQCEAYFTLYPQEIVTIQIVGNYTGNIILQPLTGPNAGNDSSLPNVSSSNGIWRIKNSNPVNEKNPTIYRISGLKFIIPQGEEINVDGQLMITYGSNFSSFFIPHRREVLSLRELDIYNELGDFYGGEWNCLTGEVKKYKKKEDMSDPTEYEENSIYVAAGHLSTYLGENYFFAESYEGGSMASNITQNLSLTYYSSAAFNYESLDNRVENLENNTVDATLSEEGHPADAAIVGTKLNELETSIDSLDDRITEIESQLSEINATLEDLPETVENIDNRVENLEEIIDNRVTYSTREIEPLNLNETANRNLIRNTLNPGTSAETAPRLIGQKSNINNSNERYAYSVENTTHGIRCITLQELAQQSWPYIYFGSSSTDIEQNKTLNGLQHGKTYTFSGDASWKLMSLWTEDILQYSTYDVQLSANFLMNGKWTSQVYKLGEITTTNHESNGIIHGELTFTVPINATASFLGVTCTYHNSPSSGPIVYAIGDYIQFDNIKLEEGDKATAWVPALEDNYQLGIGISYDELYNKLQNEIEARKAAEQQFDNFLELFPQMEVDGDSMVDYTNAAATNPRELNITFSATQGESPSPSNPQEIMGINGLDIYNMYPQIQRIDCNINEEGFKLNNNILEVNKSFDDGRIPIPLNSNITIPANTLINFRFIGEGENLDKITIYLQNSNYGTIFSGTLQDGFLGESESLEVIDTIQIYFQEGTIAQPIYYNINGILCFTSDENTPISTKYTINWENELEQLYNGIIDLATGKIIITHQILEINNNTTTCKNSNITTNENIDTVRIGFNLTEKSKIKLTNHFVDSKNLLCNIAMPSSVVNSNNLTAFQENTCALYKGTPDSFFRFIFPKTLIRKNLCPYGISKTEDGVTFTVNPDGSIHVYSDGTNTRDIILDIPVSLTNGKTYTASGVKNGSYSTYRILLQNSDGNSTNLSFTTGSQHWTQGNNYPVAKYRILVYANAIVDTIIYPMIEEGSTFTNYEPYIAEGDEIINNAEYGPERALKYLISKNCKIMYPLSEPIIHYINPIDSLKLFQEGGTIISNGAIHLRYLKDFSIT